MDINRGTPVKLTDTNEIAIFLEIKNGKVQVLKRDGSIHYLNEFTQTGRMLKDWTIKELYYTNGERVIGFITQSKSIFSVIPEDTKKRLIEVLEKAIQQYIDGEIS